MTIRDEDGRKITATRIRHIRTVTHGSGGDNTDIELYETFDGREVVCESPANNCRVLPEVVPGDAEDWFYRE